jgi:tRNA threonylcarbamoyladenosine biosynthesis protein TsaB
MILTLRTDKPEAEIGLFDDSTELTYEIWHAHRQLAETIHAKIQAMLKRQHKTFADIKGIVVYQGPGSFTGLRIGMSVANALAYGLNIPVAATTDQDWIQQGIKRLADHKGTKYAMPEYGAPVHITKPKK